MLVKPQKVKNTKGNNNKELDFAYILSPVLCWSFQKTWK